MPPKFANNRYSVLCVASPGSYSACLLDSQSASRPEYCLPLDNDATIVVRTINDDELRPSTGNVLHDFV